MSGADDEKLVQPPVVQTTLITQPAYSVPYTARRDCSCWQAIARGLAEYLSQLKTTASGAEYRLLKTHAGWAEPEELAMYPSCAIYSEEPGTYEDHALTPVSDQLPDGRSLVRASEFNQRMTIDVWCTSPAERSILVAMLEDALDPVDWMSGFRLRLPHYHNAVASFLKDGVSHADSAEQGNRRWRLASFTVRASLEQIRFVGQLPELDIRVRSEVTEGS